jgi:hypothetical protein
MRKLIFAKKIIILSLLSCGTFLSGAEKIAIQRSADSDIQSIVIEKDSLIIKSKGKTYTFKLSDLLKDKTVQTPKPVPKNLKEAFKYNGEWYFFNALNNRRNRLCYLNNKIKSYKVFKKGDLLERVLYKGKYYARDLDKNIFRPDWEIKKDFSPHLIPAKQYLDALNNRIKSLNDKIEPARKAIKVLEDKISVTLAQLHAEQEYYNAFLRENNLTIKRIDKRGYIIKNSDKYNKKIREKLRFCFQRLQSRYEQMKKQEKELKNSISDLKSSEDELVRLLEFKKKIEPLYKKYVLNQKDVYLETISF